MRPACDRSAAPRLLGLHSGALGDVVLFGRLLSALRRPGQCVALAAGGEKARLLQALRVVDEALDFHTLGIDALFASDDRAERTLAERLGPCEVLVSCFGQGDAAAEGRLARLSGAAEAHFLPIRPEAGRAEHLLDCWARRLGRAWPRPGESVARRPWHADECLRLAAAERLAEAGIDPNRPFAALHAGAGSPAKCWPMDRFVALAGGLGMPAVFLAGPAELERWGGAAPGALQEAGAVLTAPPMDLAALAGVLALAAGFVGNDSGPSHLAAALGTPTLALFGPTEPAHFAPLGPRVRTLRRQRLGELPVAEALAAWRRLHSAGLPPRG